MAEPGGARAFISRLLGGHLRRGPDVERLRARFVAIDLETTGLDPRADTIVAAAAIPFVDGRPDGGYVTLVAPGRPIPLESTRIHGITDAMVAGAPAVGDVLAALSAACGEAVLVGHGLDFDLAVLGRERRARGLGRLPNAALDTMRLAAALHRQWVDVTLDAVAGRLGVPLEGRHTADGDAVAAGRILLSLLPELRGRGLRTVGEILWFQKTAVLHR